MDDSAFHLLTSDGSACGPSLRFVEHAFIVDGAGIANASVAASTQGRLAQVVVNASLFGYLVTEHSHYATSTIKGKGGEAINNAVLIPNIFRDLLIGKARTPSDVTADSTVVEALTRSLIPLWHDDDSTNLSVEVL